MHHTFQCHPVEKGKHEWGKKLHHMLLAALALRCFMFFLLHCLNLKQLLQVSTFNGVCLQNSHSLFLNAHLWCSLLPFQKQDPIKPRVGPVPDVHSGSTYKSVLVGTYYLRGFNTLEKTFFLKLLPLLERKTFTAFFKLL